MWLLVADEGGAMSDPRNRNIYIPAVWLKTGWTAHVVEPEREVNRAGFRREPDQEPARSEEPPTAGGDDE